jgi:3-isopropylmalate/(R)-2-methylmalate dehydratase large subunit
MGGAVGAFATGVGSTEMLGILITGETWLKVPETILITLDGRLPNRVMAKDIALQVIGMLGHAGATYKALEFKGSTIDEMCLDERLTICNMAVEAGAKVGLMAPNGEVLTYLKDIGAELDFMDVSSDADAFYCQKLSLDVSLLEPLVACPHAVDNVKPAAALTQVPIHQVYIGSCTGGRLTDLREAAGILAGKKISTGLRLLVSPASQNIWRQAEAEGCLGILAAAGAVVLAPTCGVCVGVHSGLLAAGENCFSTSNRNFIGRMGSREAGIYLGSAATAAAAALAGFIRNPGKTEELS